MSYNYHNKPTSEKVKDKANEVATDVRYKVNEGLHKAEQKTRPDNKPFSEKVADKAEDVFGKKEEDKTWGEKAKEAIGVNTYKDKPFNEKAKDALGVGEEKPWSQKVKEGMGLQEKEKTMGEKVKEGLGIEKPENKPITQKAKEALGLQSEEKPLGQKIKEGLGLQPREEHTSDQAKKAVGLEEPGMLERASNYISEKVEQVKEAITPESHPGQQDKGFLEKIGDSIRSTVGQPDDRPQSARDVDKQIDEFEKSMQERIAHVREQSRTDLQGASSALSEFGSTVSEKISDLGNFLKEKINEASKTVEEKTEPNKDFRKDLHKDIHPSSTYNAGIKETPTSLEAKQRL
jgi:gas vesicle protein